MQSIHIWKAANSYENDKKNWTVEHHHQVTARRISFCGGIFVVIEGLIWWRYYRKAVMQEKVFCSDYTPS